MKLGENDIQCVRYCISVGTTAVFMIRMELRKAENKEVMNTVKIKAKERKLEN